MSDREQTTSRQVRYTDGTYSREIEHEQTTKPKDDGGRWEGDFYTVPSAFELRRAKWIADTRASLLRLMDKWRMKQP